MDQKPPSRGTTIGFGAIVAAIGCYIVLVGLGVLPPPGEAHAPMWVVMLAGLCFLLGGFGVLLPAAVTGEVRNDGELPAGARAFSVSAPFGSTGEDNEISGRVAFGLGAIITWLCLILVAVSGWRKLI